MTATWALTGAHGFVGWHVRVLARALALPTPHLVDRVDLAWPDRLADRLTGAERVVHVAGVNRGDPEQLTLGNTGPARALAHALRRCETPPKAVVFANSVQAGNGSRYGDAKAWAATILAEAARWAGSAFVDVRLPNLFGEHGRPDYNSVVATFCQVYADGGVPTVRDDGQHDGAYDRDVDRDVDRAADRADRRDGRDRSRALDLLHATDAAALLLGVEPPGADRGWARPVRRTVRQLADRLAEFAAVYRAGEIPNLTDRFDVRLFNTYRSHCGVEREPPPLARGSDDRGALVEAVRVHGGGGHTFFSTTRPGATRGGHFHLAKVERFVVLRGEAEIRLRRLLHAEVVRLRVSGSTPVAVDMPTMWVHDITNVGDDDLLTLFWANEHFDPARPDTFPQPVDEVPGSAEVCRERREAVP